VESGTGLNPGKKETTPAETDVVSEET